MIVTFAPVHRLAGWIANEDFFIWQSIDSMLICRICSVAVVVVASLSWFLLPLFVAREHFIAGASPRGCHTMRFDRNELKKLKTSLFFPISGQNFFSRHPRSVVLKRDVVTSWCVIIIFQGCRTITWFHANNFRIFSVKIVLNVVSVWIFF